MELTNLKLDRMILLRTNEHCERGEIVALAKSIAKEGLIVPLTVRKIAHTDRYEVISGVKRFYACRMARLTSAPVYVTSIPSDLSRAIVKKWGKQDMFEEAEALNSLVLNSGFSTQSLADSCGYSEKEISCMLRLTKMSEFERELVRRNGISREAAWEIARLDDLCRRTELLSKVIKIRLKTNDISKIAESINKGSAKKAQKSPKFRDMRIFDNTLNKAVSMLKDVGVKADINSEQRKNGVEYKIFIKS